MSSVVVLGTAVVDVIGYTQRRPQPGETVVGADYEVAAGGKGLNQAVAAARAGASTCLVAAVGPDVFGTLLLDTIDGEDVDRSAVFVRPGSKTGVGLPVVSDDGENAIVVVPGASAQIDADHHRWLREHIVQGTYFVSQLELPVDVIRPAMDIASERGAIIVLNPAPARDVSGLIDLADVLVPNAIEAETITGHADPRRAAAELSSSSGLDVVVTCGADGAVYAISGELGVVPTERVSAVDTVGAGDVFCGYLVADLASGVALEDAVHTAVRAATISVTRRGAAISAPYRPEIASTVR